MYDSTRDVLLRGRNTISVAHLRHLREVSPTRRFVWVDIGGGTGKFIYLWTPYELILPVGHNIEMNITLAASDAVYVVDLCRTIA